MVDTKSPGDKTLSVPTKTLTLKPRVEQGTVRQSFSHGRTKQVVVEKRGKRRIGGHPPAGDAPHAPEPGRPAEKGKPSPQQAPKASTRPNVKPPNPAARPRKSVTGRTRKPSARPNSRPRSVSARPRPRPRRPPPVPPPLPQPLCPRRARPAWPPISPTRTKAPGRFAAGPAP